jgi:hypothetical protein
MRLGTRGWTGVALYLGIAIITLAAESLALKIDGPSHLTSGAIIVMVMYLTCGAFLLIGSRIFITRRDDT